MSIIMIKMSPFLILKNYTNDSLCCLCEYKIKTIDIKIKVAFNKQEQCSSQQAGLKIDSSAQQNEKRNFARIKMQTQITRYFVAPNSNVPSWNIRLPELRQSNFHPKYGSAEVHLVAWCQNWISSSSLFSCQLRPQPLCFLFATAFYSWRGWSIFWPSF